MRCALTLMKETVCLVLFRDGKGRAGDNLSMSSDVRSDVRTDVRDGVRDDVRAERFEEAGWGTDPAAVPRRGEGRGEG
jgi:hypothetical protein